ncbi:MAG: hypothetical protein ACK4UO_06195 [Pseudolabrys sp.]
MSNAIAQAALDAIFADPMFGKAASYLPPGDGAVAVSCTVIRDQADAELGVGRQFTRVDVIDVRRAELAQPVKNGTFTLTAGGDVFKVIDDPRSPPDDVDGLLWRMTVRKQ